ncbi:MAG: D-2-hydroxyacid dehydrogenase [Chloroflexi bacterium]|nr:D-2-hydroxyacid dehydrogenase [Chloroflexota bacterium]
MLTVLVANIYTPQQVADLRTTFPSVRFVQVHADGSVPEEGRDAEVILRCTMRKGPLLKALAEAPRLKWIHTCTAGFDWLMVPELAERGLLVTRSGNSLNIAMGEFVVGFMFLMTKRFPALLRSQAARRWEPPEPEEIAGKTVGIVGAGAVGGEVARRCVALGMRVIGTKRRPEPLPYFEDVMSPEEGLDVLLHESDFLVLAAPLTPETQGMIGLVQLERMKPTAYLINIARGALTVESELIEALRRGVIAGACIDAFETEPLPSDSPFWDLENVVVTPHCSYRSPLTMTRALEEFKTNLARYLTGEPLLHPLKDMVLGY